MRTTKGRGALAGRFGALVLVAGVAFLTACDGPNLFTGPGPDLGNGDDDDPAGPPSVGAVEPASVVWDAGSVPIIVSGAEFIAGSEILFEGEPLGTTLLGTGELTATIPADLIPEPGTYEIAVRTSVGTSDPASFEVDLDPAITSYARVDLVARGMVADPGADLLYVSVASSDPEHPSSIVVLNPNTGAVVDVIEAGSGPGPLAIADDGSFLYVGLDGAPTVQRIDLSTGEVDLTIPLGEGEFGPRYAEDLVVLPGLPGSVVVSMFRKGISPRHDGVAMFDGDVMRPDVTQDHTGSNRIEPSTESDRLYGYNNETTEFGLREILVTETGLVEGEVYEGRVSGFGTEIQHDAGLIFATTGVVVEGETGAIQGTFPLEVTAPVAPDVANGRAFFVMDAGLSGAVSVEAYRTSNFALADAVLLPGEGPVRVVRWGTDGLAYIDADGVRMIRTTLID